jgi:hypothetical protein
MMDERQAQELADAVRLKSRAWMDDDLYGAFLRTEIFGSFPLKVSVVPSGKGDDFAVLAQWEYINETFKNIDEWKAFVATIEGHMGLTSLGLKSDTEMS